MAAMVCVIAKNPAAILPTVKSEGSRNIPRRSRALRLRPGRAGSRPFTARTPAPALDGLHGKPARLTPPLTLSPTFTRISASAGNITSMRDPNLISPTRCPRSTRSPSR